MGAGIGGSRKVEQADATGVGAGAGSHGATVAAGALTAALVATNVSRRRWIASAGLSIASSLATSVSPRRAVSRNQFELAAALIASHRIVHCSHRIALKGPSLRKGEQQEEGQ